MSLVGGRSWLTSIAVVSGTTRCAVGNDSMRYVSFAGLIGSPLHMPGTGTAGVSAAAATISMLPCRYSGRRSGPASRNRKVIALTWGVVVSAYGPMWPGASGFVGLPLASSVR